MSTLNKQAKKLAKKTIEKYAISSITPSAIKNIIGTYGYTVIRYSEQEMSSETMHLIDALALSDTAHSKNSFAYSQNSQKIVFLRKEISEDELLYLLSLELGYILLDKDSSLYCNTHTDILAHEFAHHIYDMANNGLIYNTFKYYLTQGIMAVCCICICICVLAYKFIYKPLREVLTEDYSTFKSTLISTLPNDDAVVDAFAVSNNSSDNSNKAQSKESSSSQSFILDDEEETVYYATKSGTKYHTSSCSYVSGKETKQLTANDINSGKFTPCSRCIK